MSKPSILVTGASGIVGYGILRSLRDECKDYKLIGSTIYDYSAANKYADFVLKALPTHDPNYLEWLCETISKNSVAIVIPGIECDVYGWNDCRNEILSAGAIPILNQFSLIELCKDKWEFFKVLFSNHSEYAIPTSNKASFEQYPLPFLLKPRHGYGSKGIIKITNKAEFDYNKQRIGKDLIQQPIIGNEDEEYSVSAFFDDDSKMIGYLPLKRKLSDEGFTKEAVLVEDDFSKVISELATTFQPIGPTNFQFRKDNETFKLLEINPRISSATSIRAAMGFNESMMCVDYYLNRSIPKPSIKSNTIGTKAIRFIDDYLFK